MERFVLLLLVFPTVVAAQNSPYSFGFSAFSAENGVTQVDAFSLLNNPSTLQSDSIIVGLSAQNIFETEGLYSITASTQFPTEFANIGIGVTRFGDELMNETTIAIGAGKQLFEEFEVGVGLHYFTTHAQFAEQASTVYPQLGLSYQLSESFQLGFSAKNPFSQELKEPFIQHLQSLYNFGFRYQPNQEFSTTLQADAWEKDGLSTGLGITYVPFEQFGFSIGGKTNPGFVTAGVTVRFNRLKIGIGGKQQSPLGISPQIVMQNAF